MKSSDDSSDEKMFQDDESFDNMVEKPPEPLYRRRSSLQQWLLPFGLHLSLMLFYTAITVTMIISNSPSTSQGPDLVYSPARKAIRFGIQHFDINLTTSPYAGLPSPSIDVAWHDLLQYSNVRLSSAEMDSIDPERKIQAVALPDGGYYGTLAVFHELHCLKRLHRYMYPSYYFPNISDQEKENNRIHNEHCIDMLRQGVLCHGDTTPLTMRWGQAQPIPLGNFSSPHECVNWEAINDWARERSVKEVLEPGYLKHPKYGVVVGENFDNKIGQIGA